MTLKLILTLKLALTLNPILTLNPLTLKPKTLMQEYSEVLPLPDYFVRSDESGIDV